MPVVAGKTRCNLYVCDCNHKSCGTLCWHLLLRCSPKRAAAGLHRPCINLQVDVGALTVHTGGVRERVAAAHRDLAARLVRLLQAVPRDLAVVAGKRYKDLQARFASC